MSNSKHEGEVRFLLMAVIKIMITDDLGRETLIRSYIIQGYTEKHCLENQLPPPVPSSTKGSQGRGLEAGANTKAVEGCCC